MDREVITDGEQRQMHYISRLISSLSGIDFARSHFADVSEETVFEARPRVVRPVGRRQVSIATSDLPLREKVLRIMDTVHTPNTVRYRQCGPTVGYWGVPPHDLRLLDLFPPTTHVYGWTRCVEAGCPADLEGEMAVDERVPTVFFAQAFCAKQQLAKYLAEKHGGLYIDADGQVTTAIAARVEAFIRFA